MLKPFDTTIDLTQLSLAYFQEHGVKAVLMDLDDTLIPEHQGEFTGPLMSWLKMLIENGIKVGIVSNNMQRDYCHKVLRHLRRARLDIPILGDALKPAPVGFKRMMSILDVRPDECMMIGDGVLTDMLGGKLAGIRTIRAKCYPRAFYYKGPLFLIRELAVCVYDSFRRVILNHRPKLYLPPNSQYRFRRHLLVVMNPKSSQTDPERLQQMMREQAQAIGAQVTFAVTDNPPKTLKQYRRQLRAGLYDCVVAAGGDGTVRAVIERVYHEDDSIPIGILPTGTGNLMSKGLGIPQDLEEAITLVLHGTPQPQGITVVNGKYVALLVVGIGLDADIMQETTSDLKRMTGIMAYVISGIKVGVFKNKSFFRLTMGKNTVQHQAEGVILIHRNHYLKAFVPADIQIEQNENVLDVCVIQARSTADAVPILQALFSGDYGSKSDILKHYQSNDIIVHAFPTENVQIDGDIVPLSSVHAKLMPEAISVIVPTVTLAQNNSGKAGAEKTQPKPAPAPLKISQDTVSSQTESLPATQIEQGKKIEAEKFMPKP